MVRAARRAQGGSRRGDSPSCGGIAGRRAAGITVGTALVSFYATYFAYRNLKSVVPLLRPDELFDRQLADWRPGALRRATTPRR